MITPLEIAAKARQQYTRLLRAWLAGNLPTQFPLPIRSNKGSLHTDPAQRLARAGATPCIGTRLARPSTASKACRPASRLKT